MSELGIKGSILCRRSDEYGEIVVAEEGAKRSLYFGAGIMQSTIRTDRPELLLEDYNEALMAALIFQGAPKSVLLIGLGGCSLVHFLMKAVPDCAFDVVEIRKNVIDLSLDFFFLPSENPKVKIFHAEGSKFIKGSDSGSYDMIIADAFDEAGPAASLLENDFLSFCRMHLNEDGVFVINLWNSPVHNFSAMYTAIKEAFDGNALKLLLTESYRNAVAYGFKNPAACRDLQSYRGRAAELQTKYKINFSKYLKYLYWQNFKEQEQ